MKKGFSLLEVLIVVLLIGILATLAMPAFQGAMIKAKFPRMFMDVRQIEIAVDLMILEGKAINVAFQTPQEFAMISGCDMPEENDDFAYRISRVHIDDPLDILIYTKAFPGTQALSKREIVTDDPITKAWYINPDHPWQKYLSLPGALYGSSGDFGPPM